MFVNTMCVPKKKIGMVGCLISIVVYTICEEYVRARTDGVPKCSLEPGDPFKPMWMLPIDSDNNKWFK